MDCLRGSRGHNNAEAGAQCAVTIPRILLDRHTCAPQHLGPIPQCCTARLSSCTLKLCRNSLSVRFTPMPLPGSLPLLLLVQTGLQLRPASLARPPPHLEEFAFSLNSRESFCRLSLGARVRPEPSSTITTDARSRKWGFCMRAGAPSVTVIALGRGKRRSAEAEESSLSSYRASVSRQPPTGWHALAQGDA